MASTASISARPKPDRRSIVASCPVVDDGLGSAGAQPASTRVNAVAAIASRFTSISLSLARFSAGSQYLRWAGVLPGVSVRGDAVSDDGLESTDHALQAVDPLGPHSTDEQQSDDDEHGSTDPADQHLVCSRPLQPAGAFDDEHRHDDEWHAQPKAVHQGQYCAAPDPVRAGRAEAG